MAEDEWLLDKNTIVFEGDTSGLLNWDNPVEEGDVLPIVKQRPNKKIILGIRFHLRLYSLSNENHIKRSKIRNLNRVEAKNGKRKAKGDSIKLKQPREHVFGESLRSSGEAPVILDTVKVIKSVKQISTYLTKKGFFHNEVRDTIIYGKRKKAEVRYLISEKQPYTIKCIEYKVKDSVLLNYLDGVKDESLVVEGENFDTDKLDKERQRITDYLVNEGYHLFNQEFIYYRVDSTVGEHGVDIALGVQNYREKHPYLDSVLESNHRQFYISRIVVNTDRSSRDDEFSVYDSLEYKGVTILYKGKMKFKPELIYDALLVHEGEVYSKSKTEDTHRKFRGLGVFKGVSIQLEPDPVTTDLVFKVFCSRAKSQSLTVFHGWIAQ